MNKRKCFGVLSSAAIGVLIASALTTNAHAAVKSYVVNTGQIIRFDAKALTQDYANKLMNQASPMYDEYFKDAANLYAFEDDKKGFVSAQAVESAYEDSLLDAKNDFNVDNFTENASDKNIIKNLTIGYEWKNGKVSSVNETMPTAAVENIGTDILGKTSVVVSLPQGVDAAKYDVAIGGVKLTYNSSTGKFTGTLTGTYTIAELQAKVVVSTKSESGEITGVYAVSNSNGRKITLIFNKEMDPSTLDEFKNYQYLNENGDTKALPDNADVDISSDNKSVTITLPDSYTYVDSNGNIGNSSITSKDNQVLKIFAAGVKDTDGNYLNVGNCGGSVQAPTSSAVTTVKDKSIKVYYDGNDLKTDMIFTNPIDSESVSASDFYLAGVQADSVTSNGCKVTLTFDGSNDDITSNTKINTIKAAGVNAKLTLGSAAGTISKLTKDVMGEYVGMGSDSTPYNYDAAPRTIVLRTNISSPASNWTAAAGTTPVVTVQFDTPINVNSVKPSDFIFNIAGTSIDAKTAQVLTDASGDPTSTIKFTFDSSDSSKFVSGQTLAVTPKDNEDISTVKDRNSDYTYYIPSNDDLKGIRIVIK